MRPLLRRASGSEAELAPIYRMNSNSKRRRALLITLPGNVGNYISAQLLGTGQRMFAPLAA